MDIKELVNIGIGDLSPYEPGKPIEDLERELGIENAIKLASNENPIGPSPKIFDSIRRWWLWFCILNFFQSSTVFVHPLLVRSTPRMSIDNFTAV